MGIKGNGVIIGQEEIIKVFGRDKVIWWVIYKIIKWYKYKIRVGIRYKGWWVK